jgi:hypothetical protein
MERQQQASSQWSQLEIHHLLVTSKSRWLKLPRPGADKG